MSRKDTPSAGFSTGDTVRVKFGVADPDYPDIPLGGWVGRVAEMGAGEPTTCLVRWSRKTLNAMHPVYRNRCERDGLDVEEMWLSVDELEPDVGRPGEIEQPTAIQTKPLNLKDQDDRIRAIFGLTHDDPVPDVEYETLRTYRDYLDEHLSFPFEARWESPAPGISDSSIGVTVVGLGSPDEEERLDETYGLICEIKVGRKSGDAPLADLQVKRRDAVRPLLDDYRYWFFNWL